MESIKGNKERILFLEKYFAEHTDEEHVVTTEELIKIYEMNGFKAHRQTVADDIQSLNNAGFEVITEQIARNRTKTNAYHIGMRLFELPELKLLIDAVSSSRFITEEKTQLMVNKIASLTNEENRDAIVSGLYMRNRLKTSNPNIFVNIDVIFNAIRRKHKISFHYWDYTPQKERVLRHNGAIYVASPYALVWNNERYYVPSYSERKKALVQFRIDRICDVKELNEKIILSPHFSPSEYSRILFKTQDSDMPETAVSIISQNKHMKNVIDRFGEDVKTAVISPEVFRALVNVNPGPAFYGWVMQYRGEILIEGPRSIKEDYEEILRSVLNRQLRYRNVR